MVNRDDTGFSSPAYVPGRNSWVAVTMNLIPLIFVTVAILSVFAFAADASAD